MVTIPYMELWGNHVIGNGVQVWFTMERLYLKEICKYTHIHNENKNHNYVLIRSSNVHIFMYFLGSSLSSTSSQLSYNWAENILNGERKRRLSLRYEKSRILKWFTPRLNVVFLPLPVLPIICTAEMLHYADMSVEIVWYIGNENRHNKKFVG